MAESSEASVSAVAPLSSICLDAILKEVEVHKYHPQLINHICRCLQGAQHLLNPILEHLIKKKVITDVALSAFLIPHRTHLDLTNCAHIKKSTLKQIGFNCPNILALNLSDCQQVSNAVVRGILAGCGLLRELRLDRCRMVTDSAFDPDQSPFHMLVGCQSIENISLQGCNQITGNLAHVLTKTCRHLKALNLAQCKRIAAPSIQSIFQHDHLLRLNLSFSDVISDESFVLLPPSASTALSAFTPTSCGKLEQLTLGMSSISDLSLTRVAHAYSHSLRSLSLEWCGSITDAGVEVLVQQCSLLEDVNLKACKGLSDASARAIGQCCSCLLRLNLSWCCDITDLGILELTPAKLSACSRLQQLCVMWTQMTGESLGMAGLQALPDLKEVKADGCAGIALQYVSVFEQRGISLII